MNNVTICEQVLGKKLDSMGYGNESSIKDFAVANELTVTITLAEYRKLLNDVAVSDYRISQEIKGRYEREAQNRKLAEENASLKTELYELKKKYDGISDDCLKGDD